MPALDGISRREFLRWTGGAALAGGLPAGCGPLLGPAAPSRPPSSSLPARSTIPLPPPVLSGAVPLEQTLARRRSIRQYGDDVLTIEQVGQLLWATQGVTNPHGFRTAPSAGATFPLEVYMLWSSQVARYQPANHSLEVVSGQDLKEGVAAATYQPEIVLAAPVVFVIIGVVERTAGRYGPERAVRYVWLEAGHAAQNLLLQAVALGLGGVPIGAFADQQLAATLGLPPGHAPLYVIPAGRPA